LAHKEDFLNQTCHLDKGLEHHLELIQVVHLVVTSLDQNLHLVIIIQETKTIRGINLEVILDQETNLEVILDQGTNLEEILDRSSEMMQDLHPITLDLLDLVVDLDQMVDLTLLVQVDLDLLVQMVDLDLLVQVDLDQARMVVLDHLDLVVDLDRLDHLDREVDLDQMVDLDPQDQMVDSDHLAQMVDLDLPVQVDLDHLAQMVDLDLLDQEVDLDQTHLDQIPLDHQGILTLVLI